MTQILLDVDGVLLDWVGGFRDFVEVSTSIVPNGRAPKDYGMEEWLGVSKDQVGSLIRKFNASPYFARLKPCSGAVDAIEEFKTLGLDMTCISSCGKELLNARRRNLREVFGGGMGVITLDLHEPKLTALSDFDPAIWVEDHHHHAWAGTVNKHESFCFVRDYNTREYLATGPGDDVKWVRDWAPIIEAATRRYTQNL